MRGLADADAVNRRQASLSRMNPQLGGLSHIIERLKPPPLEHSQSIVAILDPPKFVATAVLRNQLVHDGAIRGAPRQMELLDLLPGWRAFTIA